RAIAELHGCPAYYSDVGTEEEKTAIVRRWTADGGAIAATNGLGAGIDVPNVRLVVHVGRPYKLRDFVQESGRAGRAGEASESVVLYTAAPGGGGNGGGGGSGGG